MSAHARHDQVEQLAADVLDMTPDTHEAAAARLLVDRNRTGSPIEPLLAALVHLQFATIKRDRQRWDRTDPPSRPDPAQPDPAQPWWRDAPIRNGGQILPGQQGQEGQTWE